MVKNKRSLPKTIQIIFFLLIIYIYIFIFSNSTKANFQNTSSITFFINSFPYKANIYLDKTYIGQTPFIIRDISSNKIKIRIEKQNFIPFEKVFEFKEKKKYEGVFVYLQTKNFSMSVIDKYSVNINKKTYDSPIQIDNIPNGSYQIYKKGNTIYFIHDNVKFYISLISYILTLGSASYGILVGSPEYFVISGLSLIISIYFIFTTYLPTKNDFGLNFNPLLKEDENIFLQAQNSINQSQFNLAITQLQQILNKFPESYYVPHSLYYIAYCYDALGNFEKSKYYYEQLLQNYPIIDFYDISYYSLAKIYYDAGLYEKSIQFFQNILYTDPDTISVDAVDAYMLLNYIKIFLTTSKDYEDEIIYYFEKVLKERIGILRGEVYYNMALYFLKHDKKSEAIDLLQKIIKDNLTYAEEATQLLSTIN